MLRRLGRPVKRGLLRGWAMLLRQWHRGWQRLWLRGPGRLEDYIAARPTAQNALNIFRGEWSSRFPSEYPELKAGTAPLFEDPRIAWGMAELGGVAGQRVLELGPLEGGHSFLLERYGAASVTAIEANTRAYLKCLVAKEILGMQRTRFLCGDFMEYLRHEPPRFDLVLASGVLYHLREPAELIDRLARITDRVLLWTHYYADVIRQRPHLAHRFRHRRSRVYAGFAHTLYQQDYLESVGRRDYCGGMTPSTFWMRRDELLDCLHYFGFVDQRIHMEEPDFGNGPCLLIAARKPGV